MKELDELVDIVQERWEYWLYKDPNKTSKRLGHVLPILRCLKYEPDLVVVWFVLRKEEIDEDVIKKCFWGSSREKREQAVALIKKILINTKPVML